MATPDDGIRAAAKAVFDAKVVAQAEAVTIRRSRSRKSRSGMEQAAEVALAREAVARSELSRARSDLADARVETATAVERASSRIRRDQAAARAVLDQLQTEAEWLRQAGVLAEPHRHKRDANFDARIAAAWFAIARIHHAIHGADAPLPRSYPLRRRRN